MNPRIFLICLFKFLNPNMKGSYDTTAILLDFTAYILHFLLSIFSSFPLGRGIGIFFAQTQTSIHKDTLYLVLKMNLLMSKMLKVNKIEIEKTNVYVHTESIRIRLGKFKIFKYMWTKNMYS